MEPFFAATEGFARRTTVIVGKPQLSRQDCRPGDQALATELCAAQRTPARRASANHLGSDWSERNAMAASEGSWDAETESVTASSCSPYASARTISAATSGH